MDCAGTTTGPRTAPPQLAPDRTGALGLFSREDIRRTGGALRPLVDQVDEILFNRDRIDYLRPELQLWHKAPGFGPKDQSDFDGCPPLLDVSD